MAASEGFEPPWPCGPLCIRNSAVRPLRQLALTGALGQSRTGMGQVPPGFEPGASAGSATSAMTGAPGRTRTGTGQSPPGFKPGVSAVPPQARIGAVRRSRTGIALRAVSSEPTVSANFTRTAYWFPGEESNLGSRIQSPRSCQLDDPESGMAESAGFEPACPVRDSLLAGGCLGPLGQLSVIWWSQAESNRRPSRCERDALPTELWPPVNGSRSRIRTSIGGVRVRRPAS